MHLAYHWARDYAGGGSISRSLMSRGMRIQPVFLPSPWEGWLSLRMRRWICVLDFVFSVFCFLFCGLAFFLYGWLPYLVFLSRFGGSPLVGRGGRVTLRVCLLFVSVCFPHCPMMSIGGILIHIWRTRLSDSAHRVLAVTVLGPFLIRSTLL